MLDSAPQPAKPPGAEIPPPRRLEDGPPPGDLRRQERLADLGRMVASVVHDLNTPLGAAVTLTSHLQAEHEVILGLYRRDGLTRASMEEFLDQLSEGLRILETNLERATELVRSVKQVSADRSSDAARPIDITAYLRKVAHSLGPLARRRGIGLEVEGPSELTLITRPGPLAQVVANLVQNALSHAFPSEAAGGGIRITVTRAGPDVFVVVEDNGRGMTPDVAARAFDAFFTTGAEFGGTGLGLPIVRDLVTGPLAGSVMLDTAPGQGSRIRIRLPLQLPPDDVAAGDPAGTAGPAADMAAGDMAAADMATADRAVAALPQPVPDGSGL